MMAAPRAMPLKPDSECDSTRDLTWRIRYAGFFRLSHDSVGIGLAIDQCALQMNFQVPDAGLAHGYMTTLSLRPRLSPGACHGARYYRHGVLPPESAGPDLREAEFASDKPA